MEAQQGEVLHSLFDRKVVRLSGNLVIKSGPDLRSHEAANLSYIAANTTIPVPKVHDVRWEDGKVVGIVMDYMPGKPLEEVWDTMSHDQKLSVAKDLRNYISQLRSLRGTYIGAVDLGKAAVGKCTTLEGGPFETERMFNNFILADVVQTIPDLLRQYLKHALTDDHEIVFTHSDLAPRNILVDESGQITAILDWEDSGWYPEYWEYYKMLQDLRAMPDWSDYLKHILVPRYEKEFIGMSFLARFLRH